MAYRGIGAPAFGYNRATYTLPHPLKGSRNETFESEQEVYTNILNKLMPQERVLRFVGEYEFSEVSQTTLGLLTNIFNRSLIMMWAPHSDYPKICYPVIVDEFMITPVNGMISIDGLTLKLRGVEPTNFIPNLDNMFKLTNHPAKASVNLLTAGSFVIGDDYVIENEGDTDWGAIGAGTEAALNTNVGSSYIILVTGTTNFTLIGALDSDVGTHFRATGAGTGDGEVIEAEFTATGAGSGTGTAFKI